MDESDRCPRCGAVMCKRRKADASLEEMQAGLDVVSYCPACDHPPLKLVD